MQQSGASVATVSLAHGLNVSLVRKWLVDKGLIRAGLSGPHAVTPRSHVESTSPATTTSSPALRFVPVELSSAGTEIAPAVDRSDTDRAIVEALIRIELKRSETRLTLEWPGS